MIQLTALWRAIMSPVGRSALVLVAFLAWTGYQRHDATQQAQESCKADALAEQLKNTNEQLKKANELSEAARVRADQTERELEALRSEQDAIAKDAPDAACDRFDPATRERLQRLY